MNKKQFILLVLAVSVGLAANAQQGGYRGPGSTPVTVEEAKNGPNISLVILHGKIIQQFLETLYLFSDETGEVTLVIRDRVWGTVSVDENDEVEISGIITRASDGRGGTHIISVNKIKKL
ncbi:MAG: NirD/YgiW/YdeI family stress tolerance protein [Spirochaetaceae bacterium]|nr:NirD/YgiW/YdeI family stress tolerance protein [Spirochaetaceae bacterium]